MLYPRIIPCLLIRNKGLVKTVKFKEYKYVGDPINAVKIFNEKEVDELIVMDIDATTERRQLNYKMIENLAYECRMPLCYGGGIKTAEEAHRIFSLGVEKIAISSIAVERPSIISEIAQQVGNQSVVVVLDVKKKMFSDKYEVYTHNGQHATGKEPIELSVEAERLGAGEIIINSIDNDGTMKGYDLPLIRKIRDRIAIPMTILGGAGTIEDVGNIFSEHGIIGVAAGSLFVFKGKYKAVLINYPTSREKQLLIEKYYINKQKFNQID